MAKAPKIDEQVSYNGWFMVLAIGFGLVTVWAVYDELYTRRPWKQFQAEFFKIEERLARTDHEAKKRALESDADYQAKKAERAKLQGELEGPKRAAHEAAKAELQALEFAAADREMEFTFAKSEWEENYFYYTQAKHEGHEDERKEAAERLRKVKEEMDAREQAFREAARTRDAKGARVSAFTGRIDALGKELGKLELEVTEAERKWAAAKSKADAGDLAAEIFQYNLEPLGRVDRCQSCHMGIDRGGLEKIEPAMYRTHPLRKTLLRKHPPETFGCTVCHDGQGRATIRRDSMLFGHTDYAHAPAGHEFHSHYWERPLLGGPDEKHAPDWYMESNCQSCHAEQWDLRSYLDCSVDVDCPQGLTCLPPPGVETQEGGPAVTKQCADPATQIPKLWELAPHLARGKKVIEEVGCYGCHAIAGFEKKPKPAPDLRRAASKIDPGWLVEWIKHPKAIRPHTRMPNVFPEALHPEEYPRAALRDADGKLIDWKKKRDDESLAMAAFLLASSQPFDVGKAPAGDAARGKALFEDVGCLGCHAGGDKPFEHKNRATHFDHGPDLAGIGSKVSADWIFAWLKDPKRYNPTSRMPNLRLTDDEAADLTAFLAARKDAHAYAAPAALDPKNGTLVDQGRKLVGNYGCFGCHLIAGFENQPGIGAELTEFGAKTVDRLDFGDFVTDHNMMTWDRWAYHKLRHPRVYRYERTEAKMPQFDLSDEEIWSVMTVLRGLRGRENTGGLAVTLDAAGKARERGRELVRYYNCYGCHTVDGHDGDIRQLYPDDLQTFAPPVLDGEGEKTQPAWLFGFLKEVKTLRPWLSVRMPTFGMEDEHATALVGMFSALDGAAYPYRYYGDIALEGTKREVGKRLFEEFRCMSCHLVGDRKLTADEAAQAAPNLLMARERLRAEWIVEWLADPQRKMPGTRMPGFFPPGVDLLDAMLASPASAARFEDVKDVAKEHGSRAKTMELLRDYLMTLEKAPTTGAQAPGPKTASTR